MFFVHNTVLLKMGPVNNHGDTTSVEVFAENGKGTIICSSYFFEEAKAAEDFAANLAKAGLLVSTEMIAGDVSHSIHRISKAYVQKDGNGLLINARKTNSAYENVRYFAGMRDD